MLQSILLTKFSVCFFIAWRQAESIILLNCFGERSFFHQNNIRNSFFFFFFVSEFYLLNQHIVWAFSYINVYFKLGENKCRLFPGWTIKKTFWKNGEICCKMLQTSDPFNQTLKGSTAVVSSVSTIDLALWLFAQSYPVYLVGRF